MKTKKFTKTLNLKKQTVANINNVELNRAIGGKTIDGTDCNTLYCPSYTCTQDEPCQPSFICIRDIASMPCAYTNQERATCDGRATCAGAFCYRG